MTSLRAFAAVSFVALSLSAGPLADSSQAELILNPTFVDSTSQSWDSVTRNVVLQAIDDWTSIIGGVEDELGNVQTVSIDFDVKFFSAGTFNPNFSSFTRTFSAAQGADFLPWSSASDPGIFSQFPEIGFNADFMDPLLPQQLWFDPTPGDDGSDKPPEHWDALTLARHEIGHMLGFSGTYRRNLFEPNEERIFPSFIVNDVFDPNGLNVPMATNDWSHVLDQSFLMSDEYSNTDGRVDISTTELQMLALAYNYHIVPEPSTLTMLVLGSVATVGLVRRQRGKRRRAA